MGIHSFRTRLALVAASAAAASGMALAGSLTAFADPPPPDTVIFGPSNTHTAEEGRDNIDSEPVAQFVDTGALSECAPSSYSADIDWGDQTSRSAGTITCALQTVPGADSFAIYTVTGSHSYTDSGDFVITVTVTEPDATKTSNSTDPDKAQISDANISANGATRLRGGGEGGLVEGGTVNASANFSDSNSAIDNMEKADPGFTATIDWGDGTTSSSASTGSGVHISWSDCGECGNVSVTGSHIYDANIPASKGFSVKITLSDDGGKSATSGAADGPPFADAALTGGTAKSFSAQATTASSPTVASFTDAAGAQAAASDFTATIKWGDNVTSAGTVTKTGSGAFSVSGTHTYATQGSKTLTITVTDEEGQTVTMSATATVAAAPVVLPATGQPHQPSAPGMPSWPLALLVLGVLAITTGLVTNRHRS